MDDGREYRYRFYTPAALFMADVIAELMKVGEITKLGSRRSVRFPRLLQVVADDPIGAST